MKDKNLKAKNKELNGFWGHRKRNFVCPECGSMRRWPNPVYGIVGGVEVKQGGHVYYYPKCGKCGVKMEDFGDRSESVFVGKMKPEKRAELAKMDWISRCRKLKKLRGFQ